MKLLDVLLVLLVAVVWGANFLAVKWAVEGFTPLMANAVRFAAVAGLLLPFLRVVPGHMKDVAAAALCLGVLHFGAVFWAMGLAGGVGSVAIAAQLSIPFSTILAILFLGETVGWKRILGIVLSFAGVLVLGFDPSVFAYWPALLIMTFAALMYSVSAILMRRLKNVHAVTVQAWVGLAGMFGSLILSLTFESGQLEQLKHAPTSAWLAVLYSGIGSSIVGHGGANYLLRKYEVSAVTPYFLLTPLVAVLSGVIVLGEEFTSRMVVGGALALVGVMVVMLRNTKVSPRLAKFGSNRSAV